MFKAGTIRKIEVRNFVTYSYTELYPGPNLNMLIGPNGTGKSTMVAAIILGLGGNPKTVGRGTKISEYVKHDCEVATINIHLHTDEEDRYLKVTREFDIHEKNLWKINNEKVNLKTVLEYVSKYQIQVNNLCQFLPQDRVQDFAKLNKQELLRETQIALCRNDLLEKQDNLISSRKSHVTLQADIDKMTQKLQDAKEANQRLEGRVKNYNRKLKYTTRIQHIDRKVAWVTYENLRLKLGEIKNDKTKATELYEKYKSAAKPIEQEITKKEQQISEIQQKNSKILQAIKSSENSIHANTDKVDGLNNSVKKVNNDMEGKLTELNQNQAEIENSVKKVNDLRKIQSEQLEKLKQENVNKQIVTTEIQKCTNAIRSLQEDREEIFQKKQANSSEIRAIQNEILRLENTKDQRLQLLQKSDRDAYQAVLWLRNNKHLFKGEIFEPIMLEVNVLNPRTAIYVENIIPFRDLIAFTCTNKQDMTLLIRYLREQQNLTVNVLYSGDTGQTNYQPEIPIEELRKYGFYTYLHSLFTAPDPIMSYLLRTYKLHHIPVGNDKTNQLYEKVPPRIRTFFSDKYRFAISFSRYSGEKSTRQVEISPTGKLSIAVDVVKMETLRGKVADLDRKREAFDAEVNKLQTEVEKVNEKSDILKRKMREIHDQNQQCNQLEQRIKALERKIQEMKDHKISPDAIKKEAQQKILKITQAIKALQATIKQDFDNVATLLSRSALNSKDMARIRKKVIVLETKVKDARQLIKEAEETLNRIKEEHASKMSEAKRAFNAAKQLSSGFTPNDQGFEVFKEHYDELSSEIPVLTADKNHLLARIECLNTADDGEMKEYSDRLESIRSMEENIQTAISEISKTGTKIDRLHEEWLHPLNELVGRINEKFAAAFQNMGCAGEIGVCTGENDKDFSQYGLSIKVTYRNNEPLQELNTTVQSGGERAVATAAFMLALQELTPVPFRCVDEINQGMDSNNERRIFELLVDATSKENTSQYFLITPKLVSNLKYPRTVMVHIVHNGPFVNRDRKWAFSKFCNPQGIQIH